MATLINHIFTWKEIFNRLFPFFSLSFFFFLVWRRCRNSTLERVYFKTTPSCTYTHTLTRACTYTRTLTHSHTYSHLFSHTHTCHTLTHAHTLTQTLIYRMDRISYSMYLHYGKGNCSLASILAEGILLPPDVI